MVKTHPYSRFELKSLEQVCESRDVITQIDKTESVFADSKKAVYLCEIVPSNMYNRESTVGQLTAEIVKVNDENRKLREKIERLVKDVATSRAAK